jgi:hypothetical protein
MIITGGQRYVSSLESDNVETHGDEEDSPLIAEEERDVGLLSGYRVQFSQIVKFPSTATLVRPSLTKESIVDEHQRRMDSLLIEDVYRKMNISHYLGRRLRIIVYVALAVMLFLVVVLLV